MDIATSDCTSSPFCRCLSIHARNTIFAKPERQTISHNRFSEALTFSHWQRPASNWISVCLSSPVQPTETYTNSSTILVHRTTAHMWRWCHSLMAFIWQKQTRQAQAILRGTQQSRIRAVLRNPSENLDPSPNKIIQTNKQTNKPSPYVIAEVQRILLVYNNYALALIYLRSL